MSNTSNLDLERPDKGDPDWDVSLNLNFTKLDDGYGSTVSTVADIPETYIETGTFNGTSGDTISLPKSVDATNEYNVSITATSRGSAIGDIYVTKTTSNFTVSCSENNTSDTFAALIHYVGDVNSYGGSMYRRWYVSPSPSISDHSDPSSVGSFAWVLSEIGASNATVEFPGNKVYFITAYDVTANDNVELVFQKEAVLSIKTGRSVFIEGAIIAGEGQIFAMVDRDSLTYTGPTPLHSRWFGATHDGSTSDSNALNDMVGAAADGSTVIVDPGITRCNSVIFDKDELTIVNRGRFKPYANSGYCITIGRSGSGVHNITAYDIDVDSGGSYETWDAVKAVQILNLYSSDIHFKRVEGCADGIYVTTNGGAGTVYNKFYLGRITDNKVGVTLNPTSGGWINENNFYGGRFDFPSGRSSYAGNWHVRIEYNATHNTNANKFYAPSFESNPSAGGCIAYFGGANNIIEDARVEMGGGYNSESIYFDSNSSRNKFTTSFSSNLLTDGHTITDTITSVSSTQFTVDADVTDNIFNGQLLQIILDDASQHTVPAYDASYSAPDTTVRLSYPIPDYVDTTNEIDSINTLPVHNEGRSNRLFFANTDYTSVSNLQYKMYDEMLFYNEGGLVLRGLSDKIPALNLIPGSSATNQVLSISDFSGRTVEITGSGNLTIYDSSTGQKIISTNVSSYRISVYDSSENESVRLDGYDSSVSLLQSSDGSGVVNNSIFRRASDNKLCWKDNGGSINALY